MTTFLFFTRQFSGVALFVLAALSIKAQCSFSWGTSTQCSTTGAIQLTLTGTAPFDVAWAGPSGGFQNDTGNSVQLESLAGGVYSVSVTDATGCGSVQDIIVPNPSGLFSIVQTGSSCLELSNGYIDLTVYGGLPPYTYEWSNGSISEDLAGLSPGVYTVSVTDAAACSRSTSLVIYEATPPSSVVISGNIQLCPGETTTLTALEGAGYAWSNGESSSSIEVAEAGEYTVTVSNALECTGTASVIVTEFPSFTPSITGPGTICAGQVATWVVNGGITYLWNTGATTSAITVVQGGTYTVTATAQNGCTATVSRSLTVVAPPQVSISAPQQWCPGQQVSLTALGGNTYLWSTGATTATIVVNSAAVYTVTATNFNGCTSSSSYSVAPGLTLNGEVVSNCLNPGSVAVGVIGGTTPYTYSWNTGANTNSITNLSPGTYCVTVTDANGCSRSACYTISAPLTIDMTGQIASYCGNSSITTTAQGGTPPYTYYWSNGVNSSINVVTESGLYGLTLTDATGCTVVQSWEVEVTPGTQCAHIAGKVVKDNDQNCQNDGEPGISNWVIRAIGTQGTYYAIAHNDGQYVINVPGSDQYEVNVIPQSTLWQPCPPAYVTTPSTPDTVYGIDLPVQAPQLCPEMEVYLASGLVRRCTTGVYSVGYCNHGTAPAEQAYIVLSMDALTTPLSSNLPFTALGNNHYRFDIGTVGIGQCSTFNVHFNVSCNAVMGQTLCSSAHIYPDSTCTPANPLWSGASLSLSSTCASDSLRFHIKNVGYGAMNEALEYIVVEDHVMLLTAPVQLGPGQIQTVALPANGSTWYLSVPQVPFHPGHSMPSLAVEGCTTSSNFTTGLVNQFPTDDADPWLDIDCKAVIGSFDPNDKTGYPVGYGAEHYILPGTPITYLVRFQNTGTDTAFTVRIVDTLSQWLDPATVRVGGSSHPCSFDLDGEGVLHFLFEHILLPDSNINEAASHGFVQFTVLPKVEAPLETVIENTAAIYFDYNEPVWTNTTRHRLGDHFVTVGWWQPEVTDYEITVAPNPSIGTAVLTVKGGSSGETLRLLINDAYGRIIYEDKTSNGMQFSIEQSQWPAGVYGFRIVRDGAIIGTGKILVAKQE